MNTAVSAHKHLLSLNRLVCSISGIQTSNCYHEIKGMARNRKTSWVGAFETMTDGWIKDRISRTQTFRSDLILINDALMGYCKHHVENGADVCNLLGSPQHEANKLDTLLTSGDDAAFLLDLREDLIFRNASRLHNLVIWADEVSVICTFDDFTEVPSSVTVFGLQGCLCLQAQLLSDAEQRRIVL